MRNESPRPLWSQVQLLCKLTPLVSTLSQIAQENCVYCVISILLSVSSWENDLCVPFLLRSLEKQWQKNCNWALLLLKVTVGPSQCAAKVIWKDLLIKLLASLPGTAHPLLCALVFMLKRGG